MSSLETEKLPVSVFVITLNEEDNIRRALESVRWAKEIVVVDSFSPDRTVEVAREFTDKVHQRRFDGMIEQKRFALGLATQPWALLLDADEVVSPELRESIRAAVLKDDPEVEGFLTARRARYAGEWIHHGGWYPDYKLRLFRRERGAIEGKNPHDIIVVKGKAKTLRGDLLHFSYPTIASQVETINSFSTMAIQDMPRWRFACLLGMIFKPISKFFTCYVIKKGFLDGMRGLIIAVASSFYVFLKYAKLWERDCASGRGKDG